MSSIRRRPMFAALAALTLVAAACGSDDESSDSDDASEVTDEVDDGADGAGDQPDQADGAGQADDDERGDDGEQGNDAEQPTIVVTTSILGDVVEAIVGDQAEVVTILPVGADPHDFQASAQEVNRIMNADALVSNGGVLEEGLLDVTDNARDDGVPTHEALEAVATIEFGEGGHDHHDHGDEDHDDHDDHGDEDHKDEEGHDHSDEEHSDEEHSDEEGHDHSDEEHSDEEGHDHSDDDHGDEDGHEGHDHSGGDPHFWMDPLRMADAVEGIAAFLSDEVAGLDVAQLDAAVASYVAELEALHAEVVSLVDAIPAEGRVLVTNHDTFGYFADRYGFEVAGVIIPGGGTTGNVSPGELAELAEVIEAEGVPAIFAETTTSDEWVNTLAAEVGDIEVVELYTGSLGESGSDGETYLGMVRSNAKAISDALA